MSDLFRLTPALTRQSLTPFLVGDATPAKVPIPETAHLDHLQREIAQLVAASGDGLDSASDAELAPTVHQTFRHLPHRVVVDASFWQWLTVEPFRDYTTARWAPGGVLTPGVEIGSGLAERFLARPTLGGMARNALARLFWCAHTMGDADEDYVLTKRMLSSQDLFVGVFEREIGLVPAVARMSARELVGLSEADRRLALRRLLLRGSAVTLETLSEDEVRDILVG